MRKLVLALCAGLLAAGSVCSAAEAAVVFNFQFDNQGFNGTNATTDGPLIGPIVGTGTFTSSVDLAPGTYDAASLAGATITLEFSFIDGNSYSGTHITTPLEGVAIRIEDAGGGIQRLFFTESGNPGSDGGIFNGALDFLNSGRVLSFEPTGAGGNFLFMEGPFLEGGPNFQGRYLALSAGAVPEPSTWAMMLLGFGAIGVATRRRRSVAFAIA